MGVIRFIICQSQCGAIIIHLIEIVFGLLTNRIRTPVLVLDCYKSVGLGVIYNRIWNFVGYLHLSLDQL